MDASRFDRWTRTTATSSRRSVLRGVAAVSLGLAVSPVVGRRAAAKNETKSTVCQESSQCKSNQLCSTALGVCDVVEPNLTVCSGTCVKRTREFRE